jgi:hypothetical protein
MLLIDLCVCVFCKLPVGYLLHYIHRMRWLNCHTCYSPATNNDVALRNDLAQVLIIITASPTTSPQSSETLY